MKQLSFLLLLLILVACSPTAQSVQTPAAPKPTSAYDFSGVHLRLHNLSLQDFSSVSITAGSQTEHIGPLSSNEISDYHTLTASQQPVAVQISTVDNNYNWITEPAAAEGFIAGGKFTVELSFENELLQAQILNENPILSDAHYYANDMGVSIEEALWRLEMQNDDAISTLEKQLQENESDTFAGLWLQHEPAFGVVVAFTDEGQARLGDYVDENSPLASVIEVRPAQYTFAQLKSDQQKAGDILNSVGFPYSSGINVMQNHVELYITDQSAFEAALAAANKALPPSVAVITTYEPVGEKPPFVVTPVSGVFMPQLKQRDVAFMEALLIGVLTVEDGCLRVKHESESHLVIWQTDYFLHDNNGRLEILDETGKIAARVGKTLYLGGGEQRTVDNDELQEPLPVQCVGPFWRMGEFLPEEYISNVTADHPPPTQTDDDWQTYSISDLNLSFDYPPGWYIHEAQKALQISPNSEPTWSSIADPHQPNSGPSFDFLYNLNRQMGETPLAEVENILQSYDQPVKAISPAAPIESRTDVVVGTYRFTADEDNMALLIGAAPNPDQDSPQPVVALVSVVVLDELPTVQPIFESVLSSVRQSSSIKE